MPCRSKLLQFGFWRVMLDEAQLVAASSSAAAVMCSRLWRRHAWVSDVFVYFIGEAAGGCGYLLAVAVSVQRGDFLPGTSSLAEA